MFSKNCIKMSETCFSSDSSDLIVPAVESLPKPSKMLRRIVVDVLCIGVLGLLILLYYLLGNPYIRGFNCDDESIRYPYKENTITSGLLYCYCLIPILMMIFNEIFILRQFSQYLRVRYGAGDFYKLLGWQLYSKIIPFAFAAGSSQLITDISKYTIGRLRPHFIDLCRPKIRETNEIIDRFTTCGHPYAYYDNYECTNTQFTEHRLRDGHLSFMSGHSSFAAVCIVYGIIYIERRMKWRLVGLGKHFLQTILACVVIYTGLSRISDYKHHWSDVLVGLIQGTTVAYLVARHVSDLYQRPTFYKTPSAQNSDTNCSSQNSISPNVTPDV